MSGRLGVLDRVDWGTGFFFEAAADLRPMRCRSNPTNHEDMVHAAHKSSFVPHRPTVEIST